MTPPLSYSEESSQTIANRPVTSSEPPGTYDALFHAVCPQRPDMPRPEGPPRVPPAAATQKTAPIRPVYDDFATAHSSITSQSAKNQSSNTPKRSSNKQRDLLNSGLPNLRRTQTFGSKMGYPQLGRSPTRTPAVRLPFCRELSDIDLDVSDVNFTSTRPPQLQLTTDHSPKNTQKLSSPSRFFGSIRKALGSRSSPKAEPTKRRSLLSTKNSLKVKNELQQTYQQAQDKAEDTCSANRRAIKVGNKLEFRSKPPTSSNEMLVCPASQGTDVGLVPTVSWSLDGRDHAYHYEMRTSSIASQGTGAFSDILNTAGEFPTIVAQDIVSQATSSAREGSTVDNIVKHYAHDNHILDINLDPDDGNSEDDTAFSHRAISRHRICRQFSDSNASEMESNSIRDIQDSVGLKPCDYVSREQVCTFKLNKSPGQAPNATLPQLPSLADQWTVQSTSDELGQTSSYGDTRNLLDIAQRQQLFATNGSSNVETSCAAFDGILHTSCHYLERGLAPDHSCLPVPDETLPPHVLEAQSLPLEQDIGHSAENPPITPQLALERDISAALHRMSAFSNPSQETPICIQDNGGFQSSTDSAGLLSFINKQGYSTPEHKIVPNQGFYHESAIHQTWLDSHQFERIRIPVNRSTSASSDTRPHATGKAHLPAFSAVNEDGRDWETVFGSVAPSQQIAHPHGAVGRAKRAGSSLANNSDDGINTPVLYQHSDFSSTDRIIQHPAQLEFSHDYRYREIKEGSFPILLPSYKPSTINGFPMDSYRTISTFQNISHDVEYQAPTPLSRNHTNPFTSSPPELLDARSSSNNSNELSNWVHDLGGYRSPTGPSQFLYASSAAAASGRSLLEVNSRTMTTGSSIADASTTSSDISDELRPRNTQGRDTTLLIGPGARANQSLSVPHEQPAFVRGMPRAFYQPVRSHHEARHGKPSIDGGASARCSKRIITQLYPTNQMRPLSLVEAHRAQRQAEIGEVPRGNAGQDDFLYRSPLAPIKSKSWRYLYTRDQLSNIGNAAKADGVYDLESLSQQSSRPACGDYVTINGAWKRLSWRPQMFAWPRENSSIQSDLASRKKQLSNIIFGFCCLFPPLLILYGSGYMDSTMLWITSGDITSFSKVHKKVALQAGCFFVIALVISISIIVAIKSTVP